MPLRHLIAVVACAVLLVSCGGEDRRSAPDDPATTPLALAVPTSDVTVGPQDAPWSPDRARREYRSAVAPVNAALQEVAALAAETEPGRAVRTLARLADAAGSAVEDLRTGAWPNLAIPAVNALIAAMLKEEGLFRELAGMVSVEAMRARSDEIAQVLLIVRTCAAEVERALRTTTAGTPQKG